MQTLFGEVKSKEDTESLVNTTIEMPSKRMGQVTAGTHHSANCPFCHKESQVLVFHDNEYASSDTCIHFDGPYTHRKDGKVVGLKFTGKRKHVKLMKGSVEHVEMVDVTCPHCKYTERIEEFQMPSGADTPWECDSCGVKFLI